MKILPLYTDEQITTTLADLRKRMEEGEPILILKASDKISHYALDKYLWLSVQEAAMGLVTCKFKASILSKCAKFSDWARLNNDKLKYPKI